MDPPGDQDLFCPRCRYNLRGLITPRCPECGLTFSQDQWQTGFLRENIPTWLDRCDPGQPHQVLLRSLYELIRDTLRPRRLVATLDLNGPLVPAALIFTFGIGWLYILTTVLIAVATYIHTSASPFASLKSAAFFWTPRILIVALGYATVLSLLLISRDLIRVARPTPRHYLRLVAYWIPMAATYVLVPFAVMVLAIPDFTLDGPPLWLLPAFFVAVATVTSATRRRKPKRGARFGLALIALVICAALVHLGQRLIDALLPATLDPPWSIYF